MPNNKYDYTVKVGADISGLKKDIKSELASVLREVDNVGDAVSKGITPDTKEFESKIASLESSMEKLAKGSKDVEQQVASMKTAFKGFTELEASMKVIGEQNKQMYDMFVKMTPYLHAFADTFASMKPDQAVDAMTKVMTQMNTSGQAGSQAFMDMQKTMDAVGSKAQEIKNNVHEIETAATGALNTEAGVIEARVNNASKMADEAKRKASEAEAELRRIQSLSSKSSYKGPKYSNDSDGYNKFTDEFERLEQIANVDYSTFIQLEDGVEGYDAAFKKAAESAANLLSILENIPDRDERDYFENDAYASSIENANDILSAYISKLKEISTSTQEVQKVSLKPLKLKIDISTDDELIDQINKAIERIQGNVKINPLKIPLDFIDVGEEENQKQVKNKKKTKNVKVNKQGNKEEVKVDSRLTSVVKEIDNLQKSFDKIKTPLLNSIKEWRHNLEEYLTLEFKWKSGDTEGIVSLFDDINDYAVTHPIWLNPDTDKLISEIESALKQHQFKLDLGGSNLNVTGGIPIVLGGGSGINLGGTSLTSAGTKKATSPTLPATVKEETKKSAAPVEKNTQIVDENTDVIQNVVKEFKSYAQKGNESIARATKTIERLTKQNESLDKKNPEDAKKIAENEAKIAKHKNTIDTQEQRFKGLSSRVGFDVKNIANIDNDTLYNIIAQIVNERNEITDTLSKAKIGATSDSRTLLTGNQIKSLVGSIIAAQEALNVEIKNADQVDKEIAAKDYLNDARQLTEMGSALKAANREIRNNIVPTQESIQQVADVFGQRGMSDVAQNAQNLADVLGLYQDVFQADGGYQEYINRLNAETAQLQSDIDELSKHPRKNKSAIQEKKTQLEAKQLELQEIQGDVEPVLNVFKESIKGLPGQIAELLKGYKFVVEFVDADGKVTSESFNDKSARAPKDTEPFYKRTLRMFERIDAGEITSIIPKSTPNDSVFSVLYGDKISKSTAIQQIIDAYNQLDKKAQLFVNSLINIKKLTDKNISLSEKWALVENSGILERNNREQIGRSINVNKAIGIEDLVASAKQIRSNKSKIQNLDPEKDKDKIADLTKENASLAKNIINIKTANKEIDSFIDTVVGAYFGVNSSAKLKASQQKKLQSGVPVSFGVSKNATVAHPEERKYEYGTSNRAYRTPYGTENKSLDEYKAELDAVTEKLNVSQAKVDEYNTALEEAKTAHQQEKDKFNIEQQKRNALRAEYEKNGITADNIVDTYSATESQEEIKKLESAFSKEIRELLSEKKHQIQKEIDNLRRDNRQGKVGDSEYLPKVNDLINQRTNLNNKLNELDQMIAPKSDAYTYTVTQIEEQKKLKENLAKAEAQLQTIKQQKEKIEQQIYNIENNVPKQLLGTPVEPGSEQAKVYALREITAIEEDFDIAESKIKAAEEQKKVLDTRIERLRKHPNNGEVITSQNQATAYATEAAKGSDEYKWFQEALYQSFKNGAITWDEYLEKDKVKIDEIVAKLKETEPDKYTGKTADELIAALNVQKDAQQAIIDNAKARQKDLQAQRQEAMAFAQLTEEDLANQRAITEEKQKQVQATQQEKAIQAEQAKSSTKESSDSVLTDKQRDAFTKYISQVKANELKQSTSVKDVDLSEAINMQKQLNALAEQGNQNTEEYLILQKQLSDLISRNVNQLKGTGRNGYATSAEKFDWLKANVSENVAKFYYSDEYVASNKNFDIAVANKLGKSLVEGFSDSFIEQCLNAAQAATQTAKDEGKKSGQVRSAIVKAVKKELDGYKSDIASGVEQGVEEFASETTTAKKTSSSSSGQLGTGQLVIQADTVVVNGNTVSGSYDGSNGAPWALETTLQRTNELLDSISSKIDSAKGRSSSSDGFSTSGKKSKQRKEIDINEARQSLEAAAAKNRELFSIDGLEDSIKSVQRFDENTLRLYETFTLANGEAVKFTYSLNKMDGTVKSSYTTIANFEGVAKKAYAELGKGQTATTQLFEKFNFPQDKINAYKNAITALDSKLNSLGDDGIIDPKDAQEVEVLTGNIKKLRSEMEGMVKASEKTTNSGTLVKQLNVDEVNNVKDSMKALANEIPNASLATSSFNDKTNELTFTVKSGKNEISTLTYKFDELTQSVYETGRASKTTTGFFRNLFGDIGSKVQELTRYYAGMSLITQSIQQVRRGVQYVREIDLALTELKKVTDETDASYTRFLQNMSKTAGVVGSTTSELTKSAADGLIS